MYSTQLVAPVNFKLQVILGKNNKNTAFLSDTCCLASPRVAKLLHIFRSMYFLSAFTYSNNFKNVHHDDILTIRSKVIVP